MSTVKRAFFYTVSFITLGIFAGGVGSLLALCFDLLIRGESWKDFARAQLSLGLAMLVIGGVLWFLFWRVTQKQVSGEPAEIESLIRKFYLNVIRGVAALVGIVALVGFINWLMTGVPLDNFPSTGLSILVVAGSIWCYHWRLEEGEGQPTPDSKTLRRWYIYVLAAFGLISMANGAIQGINTAVFSLPVWGGDVVHGDFWSGDFPANLSWFLVGGLTWWFHWFYMAKGDTESILRQVYIYLLAITGGALAGLSALTFLLFKLFSFAFEGAGTAGNSYFLFLGWTIPTMIVAGAIWTYHQKIAQEEAGQSGKQKLSPRRIYLYLMSFIGLGTLIGGLSALLGTLLGLIIRAVGSETVAASGWWYDQLSISLALLVVGLPIWLFYWRRVLRMTEEGGVAERGAGSRRVFLYVVVGISIIAVATDLVIIVYQLLNGLLQGETGADILRGMAWSLQTLLVAVPVLVYHWRILRKDQGMGAEKLARRKRVHLIAGEGAADLIASIEGKLGSRVRLLRYTGEAPAELPVLSDEEIETLVNEIRTTPGNGVILVVTEGRVMVLPYEEK